MTVHIIETNHRLTQREADGELYCSRCGLFSPSDEEGACVPVLYISDESLEAA